MNTVGYAICSIRSRRPCTTIGFHRFRQGMIWLFIRCTDCEHFTTLIQSSSTVQKIHFKERILDEFFAVAPAHPDSQLDFDFTCWADCHRYRADCRHCPVDCHRYRADCRRCQVDCHRYRADCRHCPVDCRRYREDCRRCPVDCRRYRADYRCCPEDCRRCPGLPVWSREVFFVDRVLLPQVS